MRDDDAIAAPLPSQGAPMVAIRGLTSAFPLPGGKRFVVHENLDFTVQRGEVVALVGGSGTGKTVLLRQILGLERPAAGRIEVLGQPATQMGRRGAASRVGMLFQHGALFSAFSVLESNWPLRPSFPIFIANALRWLDPAADSDRIFQVRTGQTARAAEAQPLAGPPDFENGRKGLRAPVTRGSPLVLHATWHPGPSQLNHPIASMVRRGGRPALHVGATELRVTGIWVGHPARRQRDEGPYQAGPGRLARRGWVLPGFPEGAGRVGSRPGRRACGARPKGRVSVGSRTPRTPRPGPGSEVPGGRPGRPRGPPARGPANGRLLLPGSPARARAGPR